MKNKQNTTKLVMLSILAALVIVFTYIPIKFGTFQLNLALIFIAVGAIMYGPIAGALLGLINGGVVLLNGDAALFLGWNLVGTIITVLLKTALAGFLVGITYQLLSKIHKNVAIITSALLAPVVNTLVFIIGCLIFFVNPISAMASESGKNILSVILVGFIGVNFFFEFFINVLLSPTITRVIEYGMRNNKEIKDEEIVEDVKVPDFEIVDATLDDKE